jgi:hypothetical protein
MHGVAEDGSAAGVRQAVNVTATPRIVSASLRCVWFICFVGITICFFQFRPGQRGYGSKKMAGELFLKHEANSF